MTKPKREDTYVVRTTPLGGIQLTNRTKSIVGIVDGRKYRFDYVNYYSGTSVNVRGHFTADFEPWNDGVRRIIKTQVTRFWVTNGGEVKPANLKKSKISKTDTPPESWLPIEDFGRSFLFNLDRVKKRRAKLAKGEEQIKVKRHGKVWTFPISECRQSEIQAFRQGLVE